MSTRGRPGTLCAVGPYRIEADHDPQPCEGAFLLTEIGPVGKRRVGSAYRIISIRELPLSVRYPRCRRYHFACVREDPEKVPDDALTFSLAWDRRPRGRRRR